MNNCRIFHLNCLLPFTCNTCYVTIVIMMTKVSSTSINLTNKQKIYFHDVTSSYIKRIIEDDVTLILQAIRHEITIVIFLFELKLIRCCVWKCKPSEFHDASPTRCHNAIRPNNEPQNSL